MTPRRQQTTPPRVDQPVRVYKFIALSFLLITVALLGVILFMSSKRATIVIETKASPVDVTAVATMSEGEKTRALSGIVTTTVVTVTKEFQPTGTREDPGVATGTVTLHNDSNVAQPLVVTTRLLTPEKVLFRLKEGVVVPARGTIRASVYAAKEGKEGNVTSTLFTIPGLPAARQKEVYATSEMAMRGGVVEVGAVSQTDLERAKKVISEQLAKEGEKQLMAAYAGKDAAFRVVQEVTEGSAEVGTEVASFVLTGKATVLGVFYDKKMMTEWATEMLARRALPDVEVIQPSGEAPVVTIDEFDLQKNEVDVEVFYAGRAMLNPESKQIDKGIFYGKTKDEVRRYVLSLDHVRGVEVKLSPAWILTVPHIADHVSVIVKNVE